MKNANIVGTINSTDWNDSRGGLCFSVKNEIKPGVQKALLGFASGVMVAASVWSLLIPAMDMSEGMGRFAYVPAAVGLLLGMVFLLILDRCIPHLHLGSDTPEGPEKELEKRRCWFWQSHSIIFLREWLSA